MERIIVDSRKYVDLSGLAVPMAVIYDHPADVPDKYVVRIWEGREAKPTNVEMRKDSLQECRKEICGTGYFVMAVRPDSEDDPKIAETWI